MKQETKAFLVGPLIGISRISLVVVPLVLLTNCIMAGNLGRSQDEYLLQLQNLSKILLLTFGVALCIAYTCATILGIPYYRYLKNSGKLTATKTLNAGFLAGSLIGIVCGLMFANGFLIYSVFALICGIFGRVVAYSIWRFGFREPQK